MKSEREENTFEDPKLAEEWIEVIEAEKGGSRDLEIYPMLKKWTHDLAPKVLIEIGSGQGVCSSKVEIKEKYIGIEPSISLLSRAKEIYKESNKEFLIGNAYEIPLKNNSVDAVFSVGVWFHIKDLDKAHKEIYRILKTNAEFLIITANPNANHIWESWFENPQKDGKRIEGKIKMQDKFLSKNILFLHTEQEIIDSLKNCNFSIESIKKFGFGKEGPGVHRDEGVWMAITAIKK